MNISALTRKLSNKCLIKSDTHTASKWARYISPLEYVLNSGMLKTFIIIYRIISGAELDLAEGPTGHKFHILSGQVNRNINEKHLSLSLCISYIIFFEVTLYLCYDFCNTILVLDTLTTLLIGKYKYLHIFLYHIHNTHIGTLPHPFATREDINASLYDFRDFTLRGELKYRILKETNKFIKQSLNKYTHKINT